AATCTSCHGVHDIRSLADPEASIAGRQVPATCSKCHVDEGAAYTASIHWKAYEMGVRKAPVCNDCHLEHAILPPSTPESPVSHFQVPTTCAGCHANEQLIRRYGLASFRVESFYSSYHGLALRSGGAEVANCSSCHGAHEIRAASDSLSMVHPANLVGTCGSCHPGIGEQVVIGTIHGAPPGASGRIIALVRGIYIWVIIVLVGGMLLHNGLDFRKKVISGDHGPVSQSDRSPTIVRFNTVERALHWSTLLSFTILAWSGFGLAYPESFLAAVWDEAVRRLVHRAAAVVLLSAMALQVILFAATTRGRSQFRALFPGLKDLQDARHMFKYFFGRRRHRPPFGRFSYIEKFEYWALIWGIVIMGVTGVGLWFQNQTLQLLPKWWLDLFTVIHFYEAVLASLAIVVWHFYWVIFDPEVYPGSGVFWHGKISPDRLRHEHPLEWERLEREGSPQPGRSKHGTPGS
ncbi:MAG: cytochrome b/b6 domain-containing protein, partial [Candidatus Neomarinimicrobiota bacterium]